MIGCPTGSCMVDGEKSCAWRLACMARTDDFINDAQQVDMAQRVAEWFGKCERCGLEVVRWKNSSLATHVVAAAPAATRMERAEWANGHLPVISETTVRQVVRQRRPEPVAL